MRAGGKKEGEKKGKENSHLPDGDREAFPTGHAVLHLVILCPFPCEGLRLLYLHQETQHSMRTTNPESSVADQKRALQNKYRIFVD